MPQLQRKTLHPKPEWLKIRPPGGTNYLRIKHLSRARKLHTVCEEAHCPNVAECWAGGTATFMLLGDLCTRGCRFCHVKTGKPQGVVDTEEPTKVAEAVTSLGLNYVVLTSVNRDDLKDGGAEHFARTVENIKACDAEIIVEILIPDFLGDRVAVERVARAKPDVIAHNMETVRRLTPRVRDPRADYDQSLQVLSWVKNTDPSIYTKSSVMLGVGEMAEEVYQTMDDLRAKGVDIFTLGQYLRPSFKHLPVEEYLHPTVFKQMEGAGLNKGFLYVASGPLVRSSYRAGEMFLEGLIRSKRRK